MALHDCIQNDKFKHLQDTIDTVQKDLDEHRKAQQIQDKEREVRLAERQKHDEELKTFMTKANKILSQVELEILPAYRREVNAENAKAWIKEQAKSGSFWIGVLMSIICFFWACAAILKKLL